MKTTYTPKGHTELAWKSVGKEYGHVPGIQYHDVDVALSTRDDIFRCHIAETWGSAQGYDVEHGRREVIGRAGTIREAVEDARDRAREAGIDRYLAEATSMAEDAAEEMLADSIG